MHAQPTRLEQILILLISNLLHSSHQPCFQIEEQSRAQYGIDIES